MKLKDLFIHKQVGFSIVEMMVTLGVLGVMSLGIMKLMENSNKAARSIEVKDEISQLHRQISDVLASPNSCEASLSGKTIGTTVPVIYQMINGAPSAKFSIGQKIGGKVEIKAMKVKSVNANGNGSQGLATLEVSFNKIGSVFGGQDIKKEISLNVNLCLKNILTGATSSAILSQCTGSGKKLIQGPYDWNNSKWGVCQDCSNISGNIIRFCQSQGGAGVDIGNVSEMSCVNLGGTYDENTSQCLFNGLTLQGLLTALSNSLPQCVLSEEACTGLYPNQTADYNVSKNSTTNVPVYNRSCYTRFTRKSNACCITSYNNYASFNGSQCTINATQNAGATCGGGGESNWADCKLLGVGWDGNCFVGGPAVCSTTSTSTISQPTTAIVPVNKCCKN